MLQKWAYVLFIHERTWSVWLLLRLAGVQAGLSFCWQYWWAYQQGFLDHQAFWLCCCGDYVILFPGLRCKYRGGRPERSPLEMSGRQKVLTHGGGSWWKSRGPCKVCSGWSVRREEQPSPLSSFWSLTVCKNGGGTPGRFSYGSMQRNDR